MLAADPLKRRRTDSDGDPAVTGGVPSSNRRHHLDDGASAMAAAPSSSYESDRHRPIDLDFGGAPFRVSRSTLVDNSSYFESLLSDRWRSSSSSSSSSSSPDEGKRRRRRRLDGSDGGTVSKGGPDADCGGDAIAHRAVTAAAGGGTLGVPAPIFVDQDPRAFELVLDYMRSRVAYLPPDDPYLCKKALLLAEYVGAHGLLVSVKAVAMRNIMRRDEYLGDESSEAATFDARFGGLRHAIERGILPVCYFPPGDDLRIRASDRTFHASKSTLIEKSGHFARFLTSNPQDYWKEEYISGENPDVMMVVLQMLTSPNSAFTTMTEKFHGVSGQNRQFRHFYVQAILTLLDGLQLPVDFRDNCVQTITHTLY
ncbi:hypothetical protein ACHAW5_006504 [Stephanodiscus triporus]|uniref:BTB domain-containing protein n=1 Tax=Stephanodiscus triporus TaxID=2934178 RepID=A0ABD3NHN4_9STRA